MKYSFLYAFLCYCLLPVFLPACNGQPQAVSSQKMAIQKLVKIEHTWYLEEKSGYYGILRDALLVKFKTDITRDEQDQFFSDRKINVNNIDPNGIYELQVPENQEISELYTMLYNTPPVEHVQVMKSDEVAIDQERITEIVFDKRKFVKKNNKWYQASAGDLYEIIPHSFSLKFKEQVPAPQRQQFLDTGRFKVIRQNRLGVYDLEIAEQHALDLYFELHDHPLIDFVELHTLGSYN